MPNVTIKLINPIEGHDGQISEVVLREPKYGDLMLLGEPAAFARSQSGMVFQSEKDEVLKAYVERLLVQPSDPALLLQCSLADALQLRDAVFGFFTDAKKASSA